jgi:type IV pilus assembly protein PilO
MAGLSLEGKPWYVGAGIGLALAVMIVFSVQYFLVNDIEDRIKADDAQIADLDKKIEQGRAAQRKLPQFLAEVHRLELELEKLRRILPSTRNTEEIIKKVKSLVDQGDFILEKLTFPKLTDAKGGDIYVEWPISIGLYGRYHNLAILFNRLSNFSRIINVENINITAMGSQTVRTIHAEFVAKTFVYVEPKIDEKSETKKPPAKAAASE